MLNAPVPSITFVKQPFLGLAGVAVYSPVLYHTVRPRSRAYIACTAILPDNLIGHQQCRIPTTLWDLLAGVVSYREARIQGMHCMHCHLTGQFDWSPAISESYHSTWECMIGFQRIQGRGRLIKTMELIFSMRPNY
jgi:hypothetical protein